MNKINSNMTNLYGFYESIGVTAKFHITIRDSIHKIYSSQATWPNYVYIPNLNLNKITLQLVKIIDIEFSDSKLISPVDIPAFNEKLIFKLYGMYLDDIQVQDYSHDSVSVQKVNNEDSLKLWCEIGNQFPFIIAKEIFNNNDFSFYIGLLNDMPVANCMTFYTKGTLGIYSLYVKKSYRNNGVGIHLVSQSIVNELLNKEIHDVVLQSTDMGYNLYKKMGFKDSHTYYVYSL